MYIESLQEIHVWWYTTICSFTHACISEINGSTTSD